MTRLLLQQPTALPKPKSPASWNLARSAWCSFFHLAVIGLVLFGAAGCLPDNYPSRMYPTETNMPTARPTEQMLTPLPTRPIYTPGQVVDYTAQDGDTLPALAARFNTTVREIRLANPAIPPDATTMPPGMPMRMPIYYQPFWSSPYQILPDGLLVNGPAQVGFDPVAFVNSQPGWLKDYEFFVAPKTLKGGELIAQVAVDYSLSPRLLLALIEFRTGALTNPEKPADDEAYYLGYENFVTHGLYRQLLWFANFLNNTYYSARTGSIAQWDRQDGRLERPDPWQNSATIALQFYFSSVLPVPEYLKAISSEGLAKTYTRLFGDPWANFKPNIPGSLVQPALRLPFSAGHTWAYTGGPHTGWGDGEPYSAIDFAPPAVAGGCLPTGEWATAIADGVIARIGDGITVLDLDGDGDERTGWVIFYLHIENKTILPVGTKLKAGDPIGHPSCDGGHATGTHVHLARKYNGEWIHASGALAFNLEGWIVTQGEKAYAGGMVKGTLTARACTCSDSQTFILAGSQ
jgi:LasA protease